MNFKRYDHLIKPLLLFLIWGAFCYFRRDVFIVRSNANYYDYAAIFIFITILLISGASVLMISIKSFYQKDYLTIELNDNSFDIFLPNKLFVTKRKIFHSDIESLQIFDQFGKKVLILKFKDSKQSIVNLNQAFGFKKQRNIFINYLRTNLADKFRN